MGSIHGRLFPPPPPPPPDCSKLPEDILLLILRRLPIPDILRCAAVCTSWSAAVCDLRRQRRPLLHPSPWVLVHEIPDRHCCLTKFYSLPDWRPYNIPLQYNPFSQHIIGSSHGWLIISENFFPGGKAPPFNIYLLNPITGARVDHLPPFNDAYSRGPDHFSYYVKLKAICSSAPSDGDRDFVVIVLATARSLRDFTFLAFARPGDEEWTRYEGSHGRSYEDISICKDELYLCTSNGVVEAFNFIYEEWRDVCQPDECPGPEYYNYLVPCPFTGDLFHVKRLKYNLNPDIHIDMFPPIYRVIGSQKEMVTEPKILGDYAFFVHGDNSMCLSCKEFPMLRPGCIYFHKEDNGRTMCIYNLEDGSIEYVNPARDSFKWLRPTWIIPSLW